MTGLKAFILIFLMMPLGHAVMIVMNRSLGEHVGWGAFELFIIDVGLLYAATVIVIWNAVEITAKWGLDEAPWITLDPSITAVICVAFVIGVAVVLRDLMQGKRPSMENHPLSGDTSLPIEPAIWHHAG
jgi:hypothetical protein